jgi:hypothetical protein
MIKTPYNPVEAFDWNREIKRRLSANPDGMEVLRQFATIIVPRTFGARDAMMVLMPKDVDYQRTVASLQKWASLDYALAYEIESNGVKGEKRRNPKNGWPATLLKVANLIIEQHGVSSPYGFVNDSQSRIIRAKKINGQFNMFTSDEEFLNAPMSVLLTHHIDSLGKLWVMLGVPNEDYTGWTQLPFDLLDFLGFGIGGVSVPVQPDAPTVGPTIKQTTKEEKEKEEQWQKIPLTLTA